MAKVSFDAVRKGVFSCDPEPINSNVLQGGLWVKMEEADTAV